MFAILKRGDKSGAEGKKIMLPIPCLVRVLGVQVSFRSTYITQLILRPRMGMWRSVSGLVLGESNSHPQTFFVSS